MTQPPLKYSLRRWFLIGFLVVFVAALFLIRIPVSFRNGITFRPLWEFYNRELTGMNSHNLGVTSSITFPGVFTEHLLLSAAGGLATLFTAVGIGKFKSPRTH